MTVKCKDCGFVDDSIAIDAGIFISRDGRNTCHRCGSTNIVFINPKNDESCNEGLNEIHPEFHLIAFLPGFT